MDMSVILLLFKLKSCKFVKWASLDISLIWLLFKFKYCKFIKSSRLDISLIWLLYITIVRKFVNPARPGEVLWGIVEPASLDISLIWLLPKYKSFKFDSLVISGIFPLILLLLNAILITELLLMVTPYHLLASLSANHTRLLLKVLVRLSPSVAL